MAKWYAQIAANWDAVSGGTTSSVWNAAANGSGAWLDIAGMVSGTTFTDVADTFDLNGIAVNLNVGSSVTCAISVAKIQTGDTTTGGTIVVGNSGTVTLTVATATTGLYSNYAGTMLTWGTGTCSLTINGDVQYASTSTSGMLTVTTSQTLVINGTVTNSSSGRAIVPAGSSTLTVTKAGGTCLSQTSTGYCIYGGGTTLSLTGLVTNTGNGAALRTTFTTATVTGNVSWGVNGASTIRVDGGTLTLDGLPLAASLALYANFGSSGGPVHVGAGTLVWTGSRTISAGSYSGIYGLGGTINLSSLNLSVAGVFVLTKGGCTVNLGSGGTAAVITQSAATGQIAFIGVDATVTGPTLPAAGDVDDSAADFGYTGAPVTPTFAVPAEADVESGVQYGAGGTEFTGTLAAGGGGGLPALGGSVVR